MGNIADILGGAWTPPNKPLTDSPEVQIRNAMDAAGLDVPNTIYIDGSIHRFSSNGKARDDSGWYVFHPGDLVCGVFGNWRDGIQQNFRQDIGRDLSAAESMMVSRRQAEARQAREKEMAIKRKAAEQTAETIWQGAVAASDQHPYLTRKGVLAHGARATGDGRLVVPMYDDQGELCSLQFIQSDGDKKYLAGGKTAGAFWVVGDIESGRTFYVAEGFATAATIHEVTGQPVIICYSAHNLPSVTGLWRRRLGDQADLVIVADNDESGTGKNYADQASAKYGARVVIMPERGDANDYHMAGHDLSLLLEPADTGWLIPADDFSAQPAPIRWLVKNWLQREALVMVHGPSGGGKTFLVLDWILTISAGFDEWMGTPVKPGAVVYLAGEGHHGLRSRVAAWKQDRGAKRLNMWLSKAGCDLNTPEGYQKVVESIRAIGVTPSVIVVDTLHRFLSGDENSAQDAKTMLDACGALIQDLGCTVVLVHHTGVSDEAQHRARGSSAWKGALDIEISVVPGTDSKPMELVQRKNKDGELAQPIFVELASVAIDGWLDEDGEPVCSAVIRQAEKPEKLDASQAKNKSIVTDAWWASGCEMQNNLPYISRSALINYMVEKRDIKQVSAEQYVRKSNTRFAKPLVDEGFMSEFLHGFVICDPATSSALKMSRSA